jgi:hypothetical protein
LGGGKVPLASMPSKCTRVFLLVSMHPWTNHAHFTVLRPSSSMNPYFRNPCTLLQDSPMRRLAGKQEPNEKKCRLHTHHPSIVVCFWVLTHLVKFSAGCIMEHWCL